MSEISERYEPSDHPSINEGSASQKHHGGRKDAEELSKLSEKDD